MSDKFFEAKDIIKSFNKIDREIEKLWCFVKECCKKIPVNVGNGIGLYKRFNQNKWEFKSIIAGNNITITDSDSDITINSTGGGSVTCQDIDDCLGISPFGSSNKYLNEQGNWETIVTTNFISSVSDTSTVDLTVNAGNLTADVKLTEYQIGYGDVNNKLTSSSNFYYNGVTTEVFNVGFNSGTGVQMSGVGDFIYLNSNSFSSLQLTASSFKVNLSLFDLLSLDQATSLYQIGDYANSNFNTYIKIDDGGLSKNISLNAINGVLVSNLATPGTLMVVADGTGLLSKQTIPTGSVTSVDMSVPTGLSISGNPITTSGTLALSLTPGYVIPTTTQETNWNTAYTNRITSLTTTGNSGASTLGSNILNIPNYTIDGLLPSQTSNSGKFLTTDGTNASWGNALIEDSNIDLYQSLGSAIVAQTFPINLITSGFGVLNNSTIWYAAIRLNNTKTLTGVKWYQSVQGNYTANNTNQVGLYIYSGGTLTLVASSTDDGNIWKGASNTFQSKSFSSTYFASAGTTFYIGLVYNRSAVVTAPQIGVQTNPFNLAVNSGDFTNSAKLFGYSFGTSLPASINMSSITGITTINIWVGLY